MSDDDISYQARLALTLQKRWGLLCILKPMDDWYDAFEVVCLDRCLTITVCFDYWDNPYWLLESSDMAVTARIDSLCASGVFPGWFLEWHGIDQVNSRTTGAPYAYCLDFSALAYLMAYLLGESRLGISHKAPPAYLLKKTRLLLSGKEFRRVPFGNARQSGVPFRFRLARVLGFWGKSLKAYVQIR